MFVHVITRGFHFQNIMATAGIFMNPPKYLRILQCRRRSGVSDEHEKHLHDS